MQLTINRGKRYKHFGMVFDFNTTSEVKVTMYQYLDRLIEGAPDVYKVPSRENGVAWQVLHHIIYMMYVVQILKVTDCYRGRNKANIIP